MKRGLVLECGGLRSLFSEGVFDVMLEHDVRFDGMIGVSAGASIGCNFKTKQIGRVEMNPDKMRHVYDMGRKAGEENIDKIKAFLMYNDND